MRYRDYIELAEKHEVKSFIDSDPIQFCYNYTDKKDIEIAGIMASWLAYGMRKVPNSIHFFQPKQMDYFLLFCIISNNNKSFFLSFF